jgi:hypothetical protein
MKKLFNIIAVLALIVLTISSCQMKEDDLFSTDPATRQDNWMAEYRRVFNNNKYGWALYTDNPTYGRHPAVYTYAVRFDQQNCTFYQSSSTKNLPNVNTLDSVVSMYSFKMDNGIVLSFDTYNAFFHYYADQSEYFSKDLQGDFEFCLDRYSQNEDTIYGRGKTKQLPFFMVKMYTTPKDYQYRSDKINSYAAYNCVMRVEGDTLKARFLSGYHNLLVYFPDTVGGSDVEHMYSYGNLINGIYLLENFKYKNTTVTTMTLDTITGEFTDSKTGAVIGPRPYADYFIQDADYESWFYGYSGLGTYAKTEWDKTKKALNSSGKVSANSMVYICFSTDGKGGMDLVFNMWYGSDEVHFPMLLRKVSNDEIAICYTGKETSGRSYSFYNAGLKYIVDALAKKDTWTTYKITYKSGTPMMPEGFIITDESNPNNSYYFEPNFRYYHSSIWE